MARVAPATVKRVQAAAQQSGYRCNPLVGAVLSQIRRSGRRGFHGVLGLLDISESYRPSGAAVFHARLIEGVERRSAELGFTCDRFVLGEGGLSSTRLNGVLAARNVRGLLILPAFAEFSLDGIDLTRISALYLDRGTQDMSLHCVGPDHFDAMWMALEQLSARGYRRPGLVLLQRVDQRVRYRWEGGFRMFCGHDTRFEPAPVLVGSPVTEELFATWFRRHRPDVVLGHGSELIDWIRRAGGNVPETTGFVALNVTGITIPCAAVDLQPDQIGMRGTELLVGQILRGERGTPQLPSQTSPPARWVDGPTVRPR